MSPESLIQQSNDSIETIALQFEAMAARIRLNKDSTFGGAFMLVPPANLGKPIQTLLLSDQNPGYFWSSIKMMIEQEYRGIQDLENQQRVGGGRY